MRLKNIKQSKKILDKTISLHLKSKDYELLKKKADQFCEGNVSAWIRFASIHYHPKKKDLE